MILKTIEGAQDTRMESEQWGHLRETPAADTALFSEQLI